MIGRVVISALALLGGVARADEPSSLDHVEHANVVMLGTELMPMPTVAARIDGEGALRVLRHHVAIEARLGAGLAFSAAVGGNAFGFRGGVSAGYAISVGARPFVVIPMVGYDAFILDERSDSAELIQRLTGELAIEWLVYPHAIVDLSGQLGVQWFRGVRDVAVVIAPHIGIAF